MLEFYVNKNGELMSGKDKDLVLQTSKGVDTVVVHLPETYDDNNIVASITFRNPKNVDSNSYKMQHQAGSKKLTYLLDDPWFSHVKGVMQFTVRVYSTDTTIQDFVEIDDETGDIVVTEQSKTQVFTKGSYQVLEAIKPGETPKIPVDELEQIYLEITKRASKAEIYAYVEKVTGIAQSELEDEEHPYTNIDVRLSIVEQDLLDDSDIEEIAQRIYDTNYNSVDRTLDIVPSAKPLTFIRKNSFGDKEISLELPESVVGVEYNNETDTPVVTVQHAETADKANEAIKATQDANGNVIHENYVGIMTHDTIYGEKKFKGGISTKGITILPSTSGNEDSGYNIEVYNNDPYAQLILYGDHENGGYGRLLISLASGRIQLQTAEQPKLDFTLYDLASKETPVFCEVSIYSENNFLEIQTLPASGRHILLLHYNNEICKVFVLTQNGQVNEFLQQTGTTIPGLELISTNVIKVGDLNG